MIPTGKDAYNAILADDSDRNRVVPRSHPTDLNQNPRMEERHYLHVPNPEKNAAKALGARYDPDSTRWWVRPDADLSLFAKWNLVSGTSSSPPVPARSAPASSAPAPDLFASHELAARAAGS